MSDKENFKAAWGAHESAVREWQGRIDKQGLVKKLWEKDASLWTKNPEGQKEARNRLGWLTAPEQGLAAVAEINAFAGEIKQDGFRHILLLGMGGSSLAPEVFQAVFGNAEGLPALTVLDSTDPGRVRDIEAAIDVERTLFIVASKSGGTIELVSFFKYFYAKVKEKKGDAAGGQFVAITDPGTPLADLAARHGFRKVFLAPAEVGGRFSALTYFGLVPAALIGVDIQKVLEGANAMAARCAAAADENPAVPLGVAMAVLAEEGRDKLTFVTSGGLEPFADWAEQLVAESTGKEDTGIIPVVREAPATAKHYGADRFFVALLRADDAASLKRLKTLEKAGHPTLIFDWTSPEILGAEFFRWEMATAIACALLKVNAFDQPDVQSAKNKTQSLLKQMESEGRSEVKAAARDFETFWENTEAGDYVALLAFLPGRPQLVAKLHALQAEIRDLTRLATTVGLGPRYLHSTGQLHKGGPNKGVFLLVTAAQKEDLAIPGEKYGFAQLELAQAMGDFEALESKGRWLLHIRLNEASEAEVDRFSQEVIKVLKARAASEKELQNS